MMQRYAEFNGKSRFLTSQNWRTRRNFKVYQWPRFRQLTWLASHV